MTKLSRKLFLLAALAAFATCASAQEQIAQAVAIPPATPDAGSAQPAAAPKPAPSSASGQHKLGPLDFTVNWRFRTEAWDWFTPPVPAQDAYAFEHSLLRVGLGQKTERFAWF